MQMVLFDKDDPIPILKLKILLFFCPFGRGTSTGAQSAPVMVLAGVGGHSG